MYARTLKHEIDLMNGSLGCIRLHFGLVCSLTRRSQKDWEQLRNPLDTYSTRLMHASELYTEYVSLYLAFEFEQPCDFLTLHCPVMERACGSFVDWYTRGVHETAPGLQTMASHVSFLTP